MELTHLEYFRTIAQYESITIAAEKLYLTQSSLSKTLARLEKELGCTLFNRSKGRIFLNDNGRIFLEAVNKMFDDLDGGIRAIKARLDSRAGTVSVSVNGFGEFVSQLEQFCMEYPDIHINHSSLEQQHIREALLEDKVDFCISSLPVEDDLITVQQFFSQPVLFVCGKDHPLANRTEIHLADIANESFVINKITGGKTIIDEIDNAYRIRLETVMEGVSDELCLVLTERNYGVTLMPSGMLLNYFMHGYREKLKAFVIQDCPIRMPVYFIMRRDKNLSLPAQTLFDFLIECMAHHQSAVERAVAGRHWEYPPESIHDEA